MDEEVDKIKTRDDKGAEVEYLITYSPNPSRKHAPYTAALRWAGFGFSSWMKSLGDAQRYILLWHGPDAPELHFKDPRFDRYLTHPQFGRGTLREKNGSNLVIDFDDHGRKVIREEYVVFDEE